MAAHRVTDADLERWVERGLIDAAQRDAILQDLAERPSLDEGGLTLTTLLYYSGGLLTLVAYGIFLGLQWEELGQGSRIGISVASLAFFAAASQLFLRMERFRLPGELLQVVAIAVVPLLTFTLIDAAGLWPEDPGYYPTTQQDREQYQMDLTWARMALGGATLLGAAIGFRLSRSPFVLAAAAVAVGALAVDASMAAGPAQESYTWETPQSIALAVLGAVAIMAGVLLHGRQERNYTVWLYLVGLGALGAGLSFQAFPEGADTGWGVLWMVLAIIVLGLSVPLQERLFAAAGLVAVLAYLGKLVFEVFESTNAALVMIVLGLVILGIGMLYQRYSERLFARAQSG